VMKLEYVLVCHLKGSLKSLICDRK
jgi:hypothetical protein